MGYSGDTMDPLKEVPLLGEEMSLVVDRAMEVAAKVHCTLDHTSKFVSLQHPLNVATILEEAGLKESFWRPAAILHDVLEESSVKYEDLGKQFSPEVVELVYLITNEKGRTRVERNYKTWKKMRGKEEAVLLKVADYIDNIAFSASNRLDRLRLYLDEYSLFRRRFRHIPYYCREAKILWDRLDDAISLFVVNP